MEIEHKIQRNVPDDNRKDAKPYVDWDFTIGDALPEGVIGWGPPRLPRFEICTGRLEDGTVHKLFVTFRTKALLQRFLDYQSIVGHDLEMVAMLCLEAATEKLKKD